MCCDLGQMFTLYLASQSWNVHGIGCETHPECHGRLHAQEPRHQLLQILMSVQVTYKKKRRKIK